MGQSYKHIQKQIEQLQRQAQALREIEIKEAIERIKVVIAHYGLTASQLGFDSPAESADAPGLMRGFVDGMGNTWSGRGPRPLWLRNALDAGRSIDEFRFDAGTHADTVAPGGPATAAMPKSRGPLKKKRARSKYFYTDGAGNSWTGRGPMPRWLKAHIDNGKTLQDFLK